MRRKRIVYSRPDDSGVSIIAPSPDYLQALTNGGGLISSERIDYHTEKMIRRGMDADLARRWNRALALGGCTEPEALALIRDKDVPLTGRAVELQDVSDLPSDRWFRSAWTRSHNGGPIVIDGKKAQAIQAGRMYMAKIESLSRLNDENILDRMLRLGRGTSLRGKIEAINLNEWGSKIMAADVDSLRHVWPPDLPVYYGLRSEWLM